MIVGCKLPNGLIIESILIKGINSSQIIGATHGITEMDDKLWAELYERYKTFAPIQSGAIFAVKTQKDAILVAENSAKSGFEPTSRTEAGVTPATH